MKHAAQRAVYRALDLQQIDERDEEKALVEAMGFAGQWQEHRRFQFDFIRDQGVTPASRVLEIGCGPLTLGLPLIEFLDTAGYTGVDVRSSVAAIAYQQVAKADLAGKNPRIIVSENFGAEALTGQTFDAIWTFSMLFHLSDDLVETLFSLIPGWLAPGGRYWANINSDHEESRWLEFPFVRRQPEFYEQLALRNGLSMRNLGTLQDNGLDLPGVESRNLLLEFTLSSSQ